MSRNSKLLQRMHFFQERYEYKPFTKKCNIGYQSGVMKDTYINGVHVREEKVMNMPIMSSRDKAYRKVKQLAENMKQ